MASIQATRLRKGNLIKVGDDLLRILDLHHLTPGNKRGFVQCRARNIRTTLARRSQVPRGRGRRARDSRRARDAVSLQRRRRVSLHEHGELRAGSHRSRSARRRGQLHASGFARSRWSSTATSRSGIDLPVTVDLLVEDTAPGIKGATASAQVKPAHTETGLVVQVPPFVNVGDRIRVSTETGEYQSA